MHYKRILGIDYGDARIGLAQTDLMQVIASPLEVIKNEGQEKTIEYIVKLIKQNEIEKIVLGLPYNMDGSEGERTRITREFAEKLKKQSGLEVILQDERLSSFEADELLGMANVKVKNRKGIIDKLSACIILEDYLRERG